MSSGRRHARIAVLQALFEVDQTGHDPRDPLERREQDDLVLGMEARQFARVLMDGVLNNKERIDAVISKAAPAWPVEQLAVIDRIALEIGIYEVCVGAGTPLEVAINEAVELAKLFGGENSAAFVNGVLRTVSERQAAELNV